jgi:type IV pilus assembly protein PilA
MEGGLKAKPYIMKLSSPAAYRGFTLVEIMIVVVIIGLLATMAIPAFQRVTINSQDKAVLNNARQLSSAADQYFLESGLSTAGLSDLIGPTQYIKALNTIASEAYPSNFTQATTITVNGVSGTRTITYHM